MQRRADVLGFILNVAPLWAQLDSVVLRRGLSDPEPRTSAAPGRRAAIALVLRSAPAGVELLLIRRIERTGDPWSGHMALPGGFAAPGDAGLLQTALRETREEIGVDLVESAVELGRLDDVAPLRSLGVVVRPFAFALNGAPNLQLGPEVDEVIWVRMSSIASGELRVEHAVTIGDQRVLVPGFRLETHVVWGLTYRVIGSLLERATRAQAGLVLP